MGYLTNLVDAQCVFESRYIFLAVRGKRGGTKGLAVTLIGVACVLARPLSRVIDIGSVKFER